MAAVAALAGGGWYGWHTWHGSSKPTHAAARVCVTPTAAPSPVAPRDVSLTVLNATPKVGLAHQVAAALKARGFRVVHVGNTKNSVSGVATITYPSGAEAAARTVAEQVPNAVLVAGAPGTVTLALGSTFQRVASAADVVAAHTHDLQAASPRPAVCSSS